MPFNTKSEILMEIWNVNDKIRNVNDKIWNLNDKVGNVNDKIWNVNVTAGPVLEYPSAVNVLTGPKHCKALQESIFIILFHHSDINIAWKRPA